MLSRNLALEFEKFLLVEPEVLIVTTLEILLSLGFDWYWTCASLLKGKDVVSFTYLLRGNIVKY